jgi:stage II sporulation protein AB (anti-sigma F factor)
VVLIQARLVDCRRYGVPERHGATKLRLRLASTPEAVPYARAAVTRLCAYLQFDADLTDRIRLALTEACTNCVLHADDPAGVPTYVVDARIEHGVFRMSVRDHGAGIRNTARPGHSEEHGWGKRLIRAVTDSVTVTSQPGHGTRVVMHFALHPQAQDDSRMAVAETRHCPSFAPTPSMPAAVAGPQGTLKT